MAFHGSRTNTFVSVVYTAFCIIVGGFFATAGAFDIYTIAVGFQWLNDFTDISGRHSTNWGWTVAILVLAFLNGLGNSGLTYYSFRGLRSHNTSRGQKMVVLGVSSALHLAPAVPPWDAVRNKHHWADVLRAAGRASHADHVDVYVRFLTIAIIVFASVAGIVILGLAALVLACHRQQRQVGGGGQSELQEQTDLERAG
ncbi:hypothetical protein IFR05_016346 [Cadophora sp. M221]|nr:hypothetical protein IFR05_016346 [Cadophora sp. M221]